MQCPLAQSTAPARCMLICGTTLLTSEQTYNRPCWQLSRLQPDSKVHVGADSHLAGKHSTCKSGCECVTEPLRDVIHQPEGLLHYCLIDGPFTIAMPAHASLSESPVTAVVACGGTSAELQQLLQRHTRNACSAGPSHVPHRGVSATSACSWSPDALVAHRALLLQRVRAALGFG